MPPVLRARLGAVCWVDSSRCHGLNGFVLKNPEVEILTPKVTVSGGGLMGGDEVTRVGSS